MPRTPSSTSLVSVSNGAAWRTISSSSSTVNVSPIVIATSCWARTSSGLRGSTVCSIEPSCMPFTTTAVSSRSPRYLGKITPFDGSPTWCPARPMRCRPRATEVGLSTWITRSTAPMSMPSSRLLRRDQGREAAGLQLLLDLEALLPRDAAVMGADQLLAGELVEALGEPLGEPAAVGEHDRAAVARGSAPGSAGGSPARCSSAARRRPPGRPAARPSAGPRRGAPCPRPARRPGARAASSCPRPRCSPRAPRRRRRGTGRWSRAAAGWR